MQAWRAYHARMELQRMHGALATIAACLPHLRAVRQLHALRARHAARSTAALIIQARVRSWRAQRGLAAALAAATCIQVCGV